MEKPVTRAELFTRGEALAEFWAQGDQRTVVDGILVHPAPVAAALAVIVASQLEALFNEAPMFRSVLAERACEEAQS
jgi:hypothetical protein